MKVFEVTGSESVTTPVDKSITTSCGTVVLEVSKPDISALDSETITVWVERQGAQNVYLANRIPLKDFIYSLLLEGRSMAQASPNLSGLCVTLDLGIEGAIKLNQGESLNLRVDGLAD